MTKEKKDLPPMPEHDGSDNCPACAEAERVIKEMEASPMLKRFIKLAIHVKEEMEAIEKEYGARATVIFAATLENEQTDRIGTSPKEFVIKSKDKERAMDLLDDLNRAVIMPDLKSKLEEIFGIKGKGNNQEQKNHGPIFMGKPGQA